MNRLVVQVCRGEEWRKVTSIQFDASRTSPLVRGNNIGAALAFGSLKSIAFGLDRDTTVTIADGVFIRPSIVSDDQLPGGGDKDRFVAEHPSENSNGQNPNSQHRRAGAHNNYLAHLIPQSIHFPAISIVGL